MTITNVIPFEQIRKQELEFRCSKCGADRGCDCAAPAVRKAAAALAANPQKSNRALAAEAGVNKDTVRKARKARHSGGESSPPAVDTVLGRDGKTYKARRKRSRSSKLARPGRRAIVTDMGRP
jgi:transposase-like protein